MSGSSQQPQKKSLGEVFMPVGDGGVRFRVDDYGFGPILKMVNEAGGRAVTTTEFNTSRQTLAKLSNLFATAAGLPSQIQDDIPAETWAHGEYRPRYSRNHDIAETEPSGM